MVSTSTSVWGLRSWQQAASSYSSLTPGSAYYTMFRPPINSQPATYKFQFFRLQSPSVGFPFLAQSFLPISKKLLLIYLDSFAPSMPKGSWASAHYHSNLAQFCSVVKDSEEFSPRGRFPSLFLKRLEPFSPACYRDGQAARFEEAGKNCQRHVGPKG